MKNGKLWMVSSCLLSILLSIVINMVYSAMIGFAGKTLLTGMGMTTGYLGLIILVLSVALFITVKARIPCIRYIMIKNRYAKFRELFKLPYKCYARRTVEKYIALFVNDMDEYEAEYFTACKGMMENIGMVVVATSIFIIMERRLFVIILIPTLLILGAGAILKRYMARLRLVVSGEERYNRICQYGQEKICGQISILFTIFGLVYVVAGMADGNLLLGRATFLVLLVNILEQNVTAVFPAVNQYLAARERLEGAFADSDEEDTMKNDNGIQGTDNGFSFKKDIICRRLAFSFGNREICKPFDLCLPCGKKYLLTGKTGAGKTTLINLLTGIYETYEGKILYDDVDIRHIPRKEFREAVAIIHKDIFLFDDTIRRNICMLSAYSEDEVMRTVEMAGLSELIRKLPNGLDTRLTDNGKKLSNGVRQRIAIARALIHRPCFLVADEIRLGLPRGLAEKIEDTLLSLDMTVIVVSRRNSSRGKGYDAVIKMAQGKAVLVPCRGEISSARVRWRMYDKTNDKYGSVKIMEN